MKRRVSLLRLAVASCLVAASGPTRAQADDHEVVRVDVGVQGGYWIAGSLHPTGGVAVVPHVRVSLAPSPSWGVYYTQSPIVVTPYSEELVGVVDANDVGVEVRFARAVVGVAASLAPTWAQFCNREWCLREVTFLYGGEGHVVVRLSEVWHLQATGRLLYGEPTAWTWPGLDPLNREPNRFSGTVSGGVSISL